MTMTPQRHDAGMAMGAGLADVVETARRSLVRIDVGRGPARGRGSGTVWSVDGLVITNAHVVAGAMERRGGRGRRGGPGGGRRRGPGRWRLSRRGRGVGNPRVVSAPAHGAPGPAGLHAAPTWDGRRPSERPHDGDSWPRQGERRRAEDPSSIDSGGRRHSRLRVRLADGRQAEATVLAFDPQADLAALQVEVGDHEIQPIELGDARTLLPGALVVAVGHPWGIDGAATSGAVIGLDEGFGDLRSPGREWLAVGARLRPGHSGGPMLDARGRLVGINTIMNGHGVGVAIPVHAVERFLARALVDVRVA